MIISRRTKRGQRSLFCQLRTPRTIYHTTTDWLHYEINLFHLSTGRIPTEDHLALDDQLKPQIVLVVQFLHHMPQCQRAHVCKGRVSGEQAY